MSTVNPEPANEPAEDQPSEAPQSQLPTSMIDLVKQASEYEPPISMLARRIIYAITIGLIIAGIVITNIGRRGVAIPAVIMGLADSIPEIASIFALILAIQNNHSAGTVK